MLIPMPSPRGTNRAGLFIDVPSRGATDSAIGYDTPTGYTRARRYGDRRPARDEEHDNRLGYRESLLAQLKLLGPGEQRDLIDELMADLPSEDRRRARDDGRYPVELRDIDDPGAIGEVARLRAGDRRRAVDEPPPFYGRPRPGGTIDYADRGAADRRRHAMDAALRVRVDTVGVQPSASQRRASASFAARFPSAARIRVL